MPAIRGGKGIQIGATDSALTIDLIGGDIFVARITEKGPPVSSTEGRSGGSWSGSGSVGSAAPGSVIYPFGWVEQELSANGVGYVDKEPGRSGDVSGPTFRCPAFEINHNDLSPGDFVWMRERGFSSAIDSQICYECVKSGGTGGGGAFLEIEVLVDVTFTGCNLVKTYKTIVIPGGYEAEG